ncbi:tetratricopeptide repeat protein [Rhodospirillum sp. A1_3_36]|uniref:tetratricopeptide repeat protein n=1 Tax=Rhodospirillum sp. A1_3_36 TaxID=3391666 RepID=UPI0039A56FEA
MTRTIRHSPVYLAVIFCLFLGVGLLPMRTAGAQEVRAGQHDGYGRLVFDFPGPVTYTADILGGALMVQFDRPMNADLSNVPQALDRYLSGARVSSNRMVATFPLKGDYRLRAMTIGDDVVLDLLDPPGAAITQSTLPKPKPSASSPRVGVRSGEHDGYFRVVFDWPREVPYTVDGGRDKVGIRFKAPGRINLGPLNADLPDGMKGAAAKSSANGLVVTLPVPPGGSFRHFRSGNSVAVDLVYPTDRGAAQTVARPEAPAKTGSKATAEAKQSAPPVPPPPPSRSGPPLPVEPDVPGAQRPAETAAQRPAETAAQRPTDTGTLAQDEQGAVPLPPPRRAAEPREPSASADPPPPQEAVPAPLQATRDGETGTGVPPASPRPSPQAKPPSVIGAGETKAQSPVPGVEMLMDARAREGATVPLPPDEALYTLSFSWDRPTAAAAFRRAGYLWVVFDRYQEADIRALRVTGGDAVKFAEQVDIGPGATAVRFIVDPAFNPSFRREGLLWIMDLQRQPLRPKIPINVTPQPRSPIGPRLYLPVAEGGSVVTFRDPEVGDTLIVVPVIPLGMGIYPTRSYPDVNLPVTAQGVVVEPLSEGVTVRSSRQGVEITAEGGLRLSRDAQGMEALARLGDGELSSIFDIASWKGDPNIPFSERRDQMMEAVTLAPTSRRNDARLGLARFLFANGYAAEALGVLRTILYSGATEYENRPTFRAIRGGSNMLMGRYTEAVNDLSHPSLSDVDEAAFWRAAAQAQLGSPEVQAGVLEAAGGIINDYPDSLRVPLALIGAEAAIAAANDLSAHNFLEAATLPSNTIHQKAELAYLEGKLRESTGAYDDALEAYNTAESFNSIKWTPFAKRARLELEYQLDRLPLDGLINGLERLRFSWRGDDFEFSLLRRLAQLYLDAKDYGASLRMLKLAATYFENRPEVAEVTDEMYRIFEDLYLNGKADELSPITAIALYDEFRELTPAGEKGDEMIRKLADRLAKVDLLEQAATLLDRQIETRLTDVGEERSRVGARLGLVRLLNGQPELALKALQATSADDLPKELQRHRDHLEARALADLNKPNEAISKLEGDDSKDARILRAEIYWKAQNWPMAASAISELVDPPERGQTLSNESASRVLDWATALTLAGDDAQAALLRRRYLDGMKGTDVYEAFDLITSPGERGVPDYRKVNEKVAQADSFRSFLSSYRDRLKSEGLSTLN